MKNKYKVIIAVLIAVTVVAVAFALRDYKEVDVATANPGGTTYTSGKVLSQNINTSTSTFFSMQAAVDSIITSATFHAYNGAATSSNYILQCATSSTAYQPAAGVVTNLVLNATLNPLGTTTGAGMYFSSTSPGITGIPFGTGSTTARIIPAGSYLVCSSTNSVANTNSANTFDSNTVGIMGFTVLGE